MTKSWGPCTWYLFHTLAEKIKEDSFDNQITNVLDFIIRLCGSLPCPDCANHARARLQQLNKSAIKTKHDLKMMLLSFHNEVNIRLRQPIFTEQQLNEKYSTALTKNVVQYFVQIWSQRTPNPKLMAESLHKKRVVTEFIEWWNINHIHFNP